MANNRIFWAVQAVGIAKDKSTSYVPVHGLQSMSLRTTFNLEQVFEIGQLAIYENIENIPDVEMTLEKVLDGYPLIYQLATQGAPNPTLVGRSNQKCMVQLNIYNDNRDAASGDILQQVECSGMYVSSLSYTFPVDGNCTESVTLVGNNKLWRSANFNFNPDKGVFGGPDLPLALQGSGGIARRENVKFGVTSVSAGTGHLVGYPDGTLLPGGPGGIEGITSSGVNRKISDVYDAHIQSITISADLGREGINELGRKGPYFRFVNFPVEVTCEVVVNSLAGDLVSATETGINADGSNQAVHNETTSNRRIFVVVEEGTAIDLGTGAKLASVNYGGGDAGGGNATSTYTYTTFNDFTVLHAGATIDGGAGGDVSVLPF